jgi:hypothetical protein
VNIPVSFRTRFSLPPYPDCHSPETLTVVASLEYTLKVTLLSGRISGEMILAGLLTWGRGAGASALVTRSCPETENEIRQIVTIVTNLRRDLNFIVRYFGFRNYYNLRQKILEFYS